LSDKGCDKVGCGFHVLMLGKTRAFKRFEIVIGRCKPVQRDRIS